MKNAKDLSLIKFRFGLLLVLLATSSAAFAGIWTDFGLYSLPLPVAAWVFLISFMGFLALHKIRN
jgi:uncharacterized membrane protein YhhN